MALGLYQLQVSPQASIVLIHAPERVKPKHSELRQLFPADPDAFVHPGWSGWFENRRRLTNSIAGQEEASGPSQHLEILLVGLVNDQPNPGHL